MLLSLFGFILFGMGPADFAEFRLKSNHQFINRLQTLIVISDEVNKARPTFSVRSSFTRNRFLFTFHRSRSWRRYIDAVIHGGGLETRSVRKFRLWFELSSIAPKCEEKQKHMNNTEINTQQMPHYPKFRCGSDTRGNQLLISFGFWHLEFVLFLLYLLCQFHHQFAHIFFFGCKLSRLFILNWIQMRQTILPSVQWIGKKMPMNWQFIYRYKPHKQNLIRNSVDRQKWLEPFGIVHWSKLHCVQIQAEIFHSPFRSV